MRGGARWVGAQVVALYHVAAAVDFDGNAIVRDDVALVRLRPADDVGGGGLSEDERGEAVLHLKAVDGVAGGLDDQAVEALAATVDDLARPAAVDGVLARGEGGKGSREGNGARLGRWKDLRVEADDVG